jgi:hypothetical protein
MAMYNLSTWDWETGKKLIAETGKWKDSFDWVEEPYASPDGERIAAVVKTGEMEYTVCENHTPWEQTFDKVWYLKFGPDSRLTALVSDMGTWTVAVDGAPWKNTFDFVWNTRFGADGKNIIVAAQKEMKYVAVTNDVPWETGFADLNNLTTSLDGKRVAGVVPTIAIKHGDIFQFQEGCYSVAVDGKPWDANFTNVWGPVFSHDYEHVAAEVRTSLYDYTIAVDGVLWDKIYTSVWMPQFSPSNGSVTAPVRIAGKWTLAQDGKSFWDRSFAQLWHHMYSPDGKKIAAIVASKYGRWTIAVNGVPWSLTFGDLVTDAVFSPNGKRVACIGKEAGKWVIAVDGKTWHEKYDMVWQPVFSPDSEKVAAKAEKNGQYTIVVNDKPFKESYKALWEPVFSPDSAKILIKGICKDSDGEKYFRQVVPVTEIIG